MKEVNDALKGIVLRSSFKKNYEKRKKQLIFFTIFYIFNKNNIKTFFLRDIKTFFFLEDIKFS